MYRTLRRGQALGLEMAEFGLGPPRARKAWAALVVDGSGVADEAHGKDFVGMSQLMPRMIARIQSFPDSLDYGRRKAKSSGRSRMRSRRRLRKSQEKKLGKCLKANIAKIRPKMLDIKIT